MSEVFFAIERNGLKFDLSAKGTEQIQPCSVAPGPMRLLPLFFYALAGLVSAGEEPASPANPLWDGQESVEHYAKRVNLPPTQTLDLGNGVKMNLVLIPAGKFIMGPPEHEQPALGQAMVGIFGGILFIALLVFLIRAKRERKWPQYSLMFSIVMMFVASFGVWGGVRWHEALKHLDDFELMNEHPAHEVSLTKPFYMGKFAVTQEQYQTVIGANPSYYTGKDNPVETVSWNDAQDFCKKLNALTPNPSPSGERGGVRLPTEAEWEFACRAGTRTIYYSGNSEENLARVAWYGANCNYTTHPVGQKEPNVFGLYDMLGNVEEWCQDWYGLYAVDAATDPQGPAQGYSRTLRGGAVNRDLWDCRSACRSCENPGKRYSSIGFRVVAAVPRSP